MQDQNKFAGQTFTKESEMSAIDAKFCAFCGHAAHGLTKCTLCKCKGKASWWRKILSGLGEGLGEAADRR